MLAVHNRDEMTYALRLNITEQFEVSTYLDGDPLINKPVLKRIGNKKHVKQAQLFPLGCSTVCTAFLAGFV
jgi:hypothetical protein